MVKLAPNGIVTSDLTGHITSINDAFVRLTGFEREEIVGKHFTKMGTVRLSDVPLYLKLFTSLLKDQPVSSREFIYKRKDGSLRRAEARMQLVKVGNKRKEFVSIVRDIPLEK